MSWLWIKSLAPKPLKFPKTDIGTWILLSYAHTLMHIFPKEMHTAFIYSFLCDLMIYEEVSLQLLSGQLLQNIFLNVLQLSERQLICIISLGIRAVYVFRWVSSWSPEPRASQIEAWAPPCFRRRGVRHHNSESQIHLRTTCASGVPDHLPWKPSATAQLAKCPFTLLVWITFPFLRHLHQLFLGLPAEWFYHQTSSQNRYKPSYSPPPLPPKRKGRKPQCGDKLQKIAVEAEQAEWPQGQSAVLCWQLSLSPVVERPASLHRSLVI